MAHLLKYSEKKLLTLEGERGKNTADLFPWLLGTVWIWTQNKITLPLTLDVICHN